MQKLGQAWDKVLFGISERVNAEASKALSRDSSAQVSHPGQRPRRRKGLNVRTG